MAGIERLPDQSRINSILAWFEKHEHLAGWLQAIGVIIAMVFGVLQLQDASNAIRSASDANRIALKAQLNDLMVGINNAALEHPEIAGEFAGVRRLHLMRIHYFFRVHDFYNEGLIDSDRFRAETAYLRWGFEQPEFLEVWKAFEDQYPSQFQDWVNMTLSSADLPKAERTGSPK